MSAARPAAAPSGSARPFRPRRRAVVLYVGGFAVEKGTVLCCGHSELVLDEVPDATLPLVGAHKGTFRCARQRGVPCTRRAPSACRGPTCGKANGWRSGSATECRRLPRGALDHQLGCLLCAGRPLHLALDRPRTVFLTVREAMGCALPFVGTAHGGTLEVIEHGVTGLLVSPGDESDLADLLFALCLDRPLATAMGARARALVSDRFTWQTQAERLAMYYDELVGVHPCRS